MNIRRIVFLDIDGVLLPFPRTGCADDGKLFPGTTLEQLQRFWNHVTSNDNDEMKVEWVLSSTWRVKESYIRDIERALNEFGVPIEFSDVTDPSMHSERQWEIYDWLEKQNLGNRNSKCVWLALDDEELLSGDTNAKHRQFFDGHAILTQSQVGLSARDVDIAITFWDRQLTRCGA